MSSIIGSEEDLSLFRFTSLTDECGIEVVDRGLGPVPVCSPVSQHRRGRLSSQAGEPRRGRGARGARQVLHGSQTLHQPHHPAKVRDGLEPVSPQHECK